MNVTDHTLIARSLAGDGSAYGELAGRYKTAASAFAFGMTGDARLTRDVVREAFIRAFKALGTFRSDHCFGFRLRGIVRNTATDLSRRIHWSLGKPAPDFDAEDSTENRTMDKNDPVITALSSLPSDYREIIVLHHLEPRPYREMAELLGISESTAGAKLGRAREALRRRLPDNIRTTAGPDKQEEG